MHGLPDFFVDKPPQKNCWLMFKAANLERLNQMRSGLLYMNSIEYFSKLPGEESIALRKDELEAVYGVLRAGPVPGGEARLLLKIGDKGQEIDLGPTAVLTASYPLPKNYMLFCMGALADGEDGVIPGEREGKLHFDSRFLNFGTHMLLITNAPEFGRRLSSAIAKTSGLFRSDYFHEGHGLVEYKDLATYSGAKGLFIKDARYSWQNEFRIVLGAEDHLLNEHGGLELQIGSIEDISQVVSIQALLDTPINVTRRRFRIVNGKPELLADGE
jgi:hypothetical protein